MQNLQNVDPEQRSRMIAEAAYFRAEQRGFEGGDPLVDWVEAEAEIDSKLRNGNDRSVHDRLEEQIAIASEKLKTLKRKVSRMKVDARKEWRQDVEKLAELRDSLEKKLEEIRDRGENASRKAQKQAEKIWDEISDIIQRTAPRRK